MNKIHDPSDFPCQESQEQARRLYRYISDASRKLDEIRGRACTVNDLFVPTLISRRSRFREHCERLIFSQPLMYGSKGEELLWRKGYYDVVSVAKRLKKQNFTDVESAFLQGHINSGIGHYHHIICRLQIEFDLNLHGSTDFPIFIDEYMVDRPPANKNISEDLLEWAKDSLHRCLIYLGDLSRYKLELNPDADSGLAIRYYMQAANYNSKLGVPYNQLGTLSMSTNYSLDAAYYYMRCLSCQHPFEGSEGNLQRLFEKNSHLLEQILSEKEINPPEPIGHIKKFISRFLLLTDIWYFDKKISNVHSLCHETLLDLRTCLSYSKPVSSEFDDNNSEPDTCSKVPVEITSPQYLNAEIVFKIVVMCILCIMKLQNNSSVQLSAVVAFSLAVYSQLIQCVVERIQDSVFNLSIPNSIPDVDTTDKVDILIENQKKVHKKKKRSILKIRRRRKCINSSEESDLSDNEVSYESSYSSDDGNSDISEEAHSDSESEDDDSDRDKIPGEETKDEKIEQKTNTNACPVMVNGSEEKKPNDEPLHNGELIQKIKKLEPNDMLELIVDEGILQSIKILSDWLMGDIEVIKACGQTSQTLIQKIVQLINLLNVNTDIPNLENVKTNPASLKQNHKTIALPEDLTLKDLRILAVAHKNIEWDTIDSSTFLPKEEALVRLYKLVTFGHFLTGIPESGVQYDMKENNFIVPAKVHNSFEEKPTTNDMDDKSPNDANNEPAHGISRGQLMKSMGQLWLAAEVRDLECRVKGRTALSPYLVLDAEALIRHSYLVKQLAGARKFIIVVPSIVVSALDELKRETGKARDAIRWLESQFHRGNRFLRAQRNHETAPLPLIKYPKKKDKESYTFIKIIECCHFLTQQQKDSSDLVTLLTGNPAAISENREISYVGLARSAGVTLEVITTFHTKWKKSMKGYR